MIARETILEALQPIQEPELGRSLVELGFIRDLMIKEDQLRMTVVLASDGDAQQAEIKQRITECLQAIEAPPTYIRFREMTEYERNQLNEPSAPKETKGAAAGAGPKKPPTHADGLQSSLLRPESGVEFIAVASGKGGVGKSTVTVNLAVAMARLGLRVGIMDADIYGFSVPDMMGIEGKPEVRDNKVIPIRSHGVQVISMGFFVQENAPVIWRGPMLGKMLRNFFSDIAWEPVDVMFLDLPPGTGDVALDVHQMIPQSKEIVVTTPHATAAFVAARAGAMALQTDHEILGVVENMAYYQCGECGNKDYIFGRGGGAKLAEELHTGLLAQIPLGAPDNHPSEPDFSPSVYKKDSPTGKIYMEVAETLARKLGKTPAGAK